jgi:23S rRNA pseudouridine1911/1915/1917 synthase
MKSFDSVYCDNHLLVALKDPGILTQPDETNHESLETIAKEWLKKEFSKPGRVFLHCIHRLDRPVSGLVLFARTSKALSRLNEQSRAQEIQRVYLAEVEGVLPELEGRLDHYLVHGDHKAILATEKTPQAKHARLTFRTLERRAHSTVVEIELETGRYHQVRAQFSAIGHPVLRDQKYGAKQGDGSEIFLHCAKLKFYHPVTKEIVSVSSNASFYCY